MTKDRLPKGIFEEERDAEDASFAAASAKLRRIIDGKAEIDFAAALSREECAASLDIPVAAILATIESRALPCKDGAVTIADFTAWVRTWAEKPNGPTN